MRAVEKEFEAVKEKQLELLASITELIEKRLPPQGRTWTWENVGQEEEIVVGLELLQTVLSNRQRRTV